MFGPLESQCGKYFHLEQVEIMIDDILEPYGWLSNKEAFFEIPKGDKLSKPDFCPDVCSL